MHLLYRRPQAVLCPLPPPPPPPSRRSRGRRRGACTRAGPSSSSRGLPTHRTGQRTGAASARHFACSARCVCGVGMQHAATSNPGARGAQQRYETTVTVLRPSVPVLVPLGICAIRELTKFTFSRRKVARYVTVCLTRVTSATASRSGHRPPRSSTPSALPGQDLVCNRTAAG